MGYLPDYVFLLCVHILLGISVLVDVFCGCAQIFFDLCTPLRILHPLRAFTQSVQEGNAARLVHDVVKDLAQPIEFLVATLCFYEANGQINIKCKLFNLFVPPRIRIIPGIWIREPFMYNTMKWCEVCPLDLLPRFRIG